MSGIIVSKKSGVIGKLVGVDTVGVNTTNPFSDVDVRGGSGGSNATVAIGPYYSSQADSRNWRIKTNQSVWGDLMIMHSSTNTGTPDQVYAFKITQGSSAANTGTHVYGALSKASGSFRIDHPLPSKKDSHDLVHSFVEGPRADLIYRGTTTLVDGKSTVDLDTAAGMSKGTWVLLCTSEQVFTSNETGWNHVRGLVSGSTLRIECQDENSTDTISWMVVAERCDNHMKEASWTDENGKPIIEPEKIGEIAE